MSQQKAERSRFHWPLRLTVVLLAVVVVYLAVIAVQVVGSAGRDERSPADAIVVLGAAQYDGHPSPALKRRLDKALELYRDGVAPTIVLTGSKRGADRFTEAYAGFKYLRNEGVDDSNLVVVDDGRTTWESLAAASRVLADKHIDRVVLVSSSYHNRRLEGIASELDLEATVSPTRGSPSITQVMGETIRVGVGEIVGYRRLYNIRG